MKRSSECRGPWSSGVTKLIASPTACARPGAADAMHVILRVHRKVVIHHVRNAVHVDAARGDVGRDEHAHRAGFEILQGAQSLVLRAIGVNRSRLDARAFESARDAIGAVFRPRENEHGIELRIAQQMQQERWLQVLPALRRQIA